MTIEHAAIRVVDKPWGSRDLRPWSKLQDGAAIGELWFERSDPDASPSALLLKLLFTTAPLSIQVHPDDSFARSVGLDHGKTEAWYVLSAEPGAKVAAGLAGRLTPPQLRASIEDGSIEDLVQWRGVLKGDLVSIPAGTIHAIGAGLVLAEIQQRSDTTYRLFDYGRHRQLHVDSAVAVSDAGPAATQPIPVRLSGERTLLVANPYFALERVDLPPATAWELDASGEAWLLAFEGGAPTGTTTMRIGEALFLEEDRVVLEVGPQGLSGLLAYAAPHAKPSLLLRAGDGISRVGGPSLPLGIHDPASAMPRGVL
ncbi:class I mannose-6-phosphate isomerase [Labrys monachus]|uniref:Mannose-6-phosphate isomerase n=1 Tax=Labrys monachus TaxID=217067 RepID=A0ABU0FE20_9HYPH|nr:class I mannose-6-phosphate isomerase [Labrys monachus]MDQ0392859.1 mannose-6-phosphate isomerase [Labrys monachus]